MNWHLLAACVPLLFLAYQLLIDWVDLFPWNDLSTKSARTRLLELLLNYTPLLLIAYGLWEHTPGARLGALLGSLAYLVGHLNAWWRPYLWGAPAQEQQEYAQHFSRTYKFLPLIKNHPVPDAAHVVLGGICLLMVGCSVAVYFH